jgi:hypothetical protein
MAEAGRPGSEEEEVEVELVVVVEVEGGGGIAMSARRRLSEMTSPVSLSLACF